MEKQKFYLPLLALLLVPVLRLDGAFFVIPTGNANAEANSGQNSMVRNSGFARSYQMGIKAGNLADLPVGSTITGFSFRLDAGQTTWPPTDVTWSDYEITFAEWTNAANGFSIVYSQNMTNPVLVHDGALTIGASSLVGGVGANPWGPTIAFQTPYVYQGGALSIMIRHDGSNASTTRFLDAVSYSFADGFVAQLSSVRNATASSDAASLTVLRLEYTSAAESSAVPEPSTMGIGAVALTAILWRRAHRLRN
jgi:hypothetical protein